MKKVFLVVIVLLIITAIAIVCFDIYKKENVLEIGDLESIKDYKENVIAVRMKEETEGGYLYYKTTDKKVIQEICEAFGMIEVGNQADINVVDNSRTYILDISDGTHKTFSFNGSFYYKNNTNYETKNYIKLKGISLDESSKWD